MIFVALLVGAGALAAVLTFVLGLGLGRSDAAGNGLAEAYVAIATAVTTLLVVGALLAAWASEAPAAVSTGAGTIAGLALALAIPLPTLRCQFSRRNPRAARTTIAGLTALAQLGILLHAADRAFAWYLPTGVAGLGPGLLGALALVAPLLASTAGKARTARQRPSPSMIAWPALVVREGEAVFVVRDASGLATLDPTVFTRAPVPQVLDANGTPWTLTPAATLAEWTATPAGAAVSLAAVRASLLAIPTLHPDPAQDAALRRLVTMQSSLTALTFVLPR